MSSRVLKKLQGTDDLSIPKQDDENSEPDSQIVIGGTRKVNINPYDMVIFNKNIGFSNIFDNFSYFCSQFIEQSMSESEVKEDDNETEHASASAAAASSARTEQAKKKKKKRKKKGTKQQQSAGQRRSSEDKSDVKLFNKYKHNNQ